MTALDNWITELQAGNYSLQPQNLISRVQTAINALQFMFGVGQGNPVAWTPSDVSGAGLIFSGVSASYSQVGNMIFAYGSVTYPATANGSQAVIGGLPFPCANQNYMFFNLLQTMNSVQVGVYPNKGVNNFSLMTATGANLPVSTFSSAAIRFFVPYPLA